jgi:hypothetical protein
MTVTCRCTVTQPDCVMGQNLFINIKICYKAGIVTNGVVPVGMNWMTALGLYSKHCKENRSGQNV